MSSILDIDLDYFNLVESPIQRLVELLAWADCPVAFIVENHHKAFARWKNRVKRGMLAPPTYILHVDEHHDMMDERKNSNIANFMYHAMRTWQDCRVHWLVQQRIDSPHMWLSDDVWGSFASRFSVSPHRPRGWPRPDLVSMCSSPNFLDEDLRQRLLNTTQQFLKVTGQEPLKEKDCLTNRCT